MSTHQNRRSDMATVRDCGHKATSPLNADVIQQLLASHAPLSGSQRKH